MICSADATVEEPSFDSTRNDPVVERHGSKAVQGLARAVGIGGELGSDS